MKSVFCISLSLLSLILAGIMGGFYLKLRHTYQVQQAALQQQISVLQQQLKQQAQPDQFTPRNQLIAILFDARADDPERKEPQNKLTPHHKQKRVPAFNERLRRDAALEFVKLEYDAGKRWHEIDLSNAFLSGVNLSRHELIKLNIKDALIRSNFCDADLRSANFRNSSFGSTNFKRADLARADFSGAEMEGVVFSGANLDKANLISVHAEGASIIQAQARGANFYAANLKDVLFWESHLEGASFWNANLEDASLGGADLKEASFRNAFMLGTELMGSNLEGASFMGAYMEKADLRGAALTGANFYGASLAGAIVDSPDWINQLRNLDPPVENFQFNRWSIVNGEDDYGESVYRLDGPLTALKPERSLYRDLSTSDE